LTLGHVVFVFTKEDLVEIREKLVERKVKAPALAGDITSSFCPRTPASDLTD
jgi:hypothetical protein